MHGKMGTWTLSHVSACITGLQLGVPSSPSSLVSARSHLALALFKPEIRTCGGAEAFLASLRFTEWPERLNWWFWSGKDFWRKNVFLRSVNTHTVAARIEPWELNCLPLVPPWSQAQKR